MASNWTSGNFLFPTSTGAYSVTGLEFEPQGIFWIYTNLSALDTVVTTSYPTLGFGMTWIDKDSGLPDSQAVTNVMTAGINVKPQPIVMTDSLGCVEEYAATLTSLNSDGFTLNVTNAAPGDRWITWMAFGGFQLAGGSANLATNTIYTIGRQALTAFAMNYRTTSGIRNGCETARYTSLYVGATSWPKEDTPSFNTRSWGSAGTSYFPITGAQGFTTSFFNINPPPQFQSAINISTGDSPPIVLQDLIYLWRPVTMTQVQTAVGGGPLRWMAQWWDAENWNNSFQPALDVGDPSFFSSGNPFLNEIQGAMYVGILGPDADGLSAKSRLAIGLLTNDAQGVVAAEGQGGTAFYSIDNFCVPNLTLSGTGTLAASGSISGDTITATTTRNDGWADTFEGGIFAWGPAVGGWIPQIYRRWPY